MKTTDSSAKQCSFQDGNWVGNFKARVALGFINRALRPEDVGESKSITPPFVTSARLDNIELRKISCPSWSQTSIPGSSSTHPVGMITELSRFHDANWVPTKKF
jgi:hypothetical protein